MTEFIKRFMDNLKEILDKPPYLIFVFVGSVFLAISIATQNDVAQSLVFFLYATSGAVWRHATKDLRGRLREAYPQKFIQIELWGVGIYQFVNLALVVWLVIVMLKLFTEVI